MYTLLSQIYASYNRKEEYSVLILGLDDAGKTTLLERMKSQNGVQSLSSDKITPTIGQNSTSNIPYIPFHPVYEIRHS